ncbi:MAG: class I SAM-dependent methyltransferase [Pseudomonadota bacterium]|nr:class I SAM-dependent methyltransferase [Pseudomonadota bacterium]
MGKLGKAISIYKNEGVGSLLRQARRFLEASSRTARAVGILQLRTAKHKAAIPLFEWLDRLFSHDTAQDPYHLNFRYFIEQVNQAMGPKILELGSRNVTGKTYKCLFANWGEYVGFDIHPGENVDQVGDVHRLSHYLQNEHFDFVFSISVFEHLAMPWKAVLEINKVMKTGGLLFISTHPIWPPHELPWDFWRYFEGTFRVILNPLTGFEIVRCNEGLPCSIVPLVNEPSMVGLWKSRANLGVSVVAKKIGAPDQSLSWDVQLEEILSSAYPTRT